jgi:hypothetical protein
MQNHVAFRVDWSKEQILEELNGKGIAARYEPRGAGFDIVGFDDPDGNFVEVFPGIETADLPPEAFSASGELERVMAEMAVWVNSVAVIRDGQTIFPLAPRLRTPKPRAGLASGFRRQLARTAGRDDDTFRSESR